MMKNLCYVFLAIFMAFSQHSYAQWETFTDPGLKSFLSKGAKYGDEYFFVHNLRVIKSDDISKLAVDDNNLGLLIADIKENEDLEVLMARGSNKFYIYDDITGTNKFIDAGLTLPSGNINDFCFKGIATYVATSQTGIYENPNTDPSNWKLLSPDSLKTTTYSLIEVQQDSLLVASNVALGFAHAYNFNTKKWTRIVSPSNHQTYVFKSGLWAWTNGVSNQLKKYNFETKKWDSWGKPITSMTFVSAIVKIGTDYFVHGRAGIKKSSDNGNTWKDVLTFTDGYFTVSDLRASSTSLVAASQRGAYESKDGGNTWVHYPVPNSTSTAILGRNDIQTLDNIAFTSNVLGIQKSDEATKSIKLYNNGLPYPSSSRLYKTNNKLYALDLYYGIYTLNKADGQWTKVNSPNNAGFSFNNGLFVGKDTAMLVSTNSSAFYSTNAGTTWVNLPTASILNEVIQHQKTIFGFTSTNFYRFDAQNNKFIPKVYPSTIFGTHIQAISYKDKIILAKNSGVFICDSSFQNTVQLTKTNMRSIFEYNNRLYLGSNLSSDTTKIYGTDDLKTLKTYRGNISKTSSTTIRGFAVDKNYFYVNTSSSPEIFYRRPLGSLVGNEDISEIEPAQVFPNPAQNYIKVSNLAFIALEVFDYQVFDINGRLFLTGKVSGEKDLEINIESLNSGTYFVKLNGGKYIYASQFVKL